ncbi:hypothetical protein [Methanobacterium oryzae]|uniref:hypothetical protein n=1 Tax=Methanobacterium oryzae TaxID=69540 RepID=UPI003D22C026
MIKKIYQGKLIKVNKSSNADLRLDKYKKPLNEVINRDSKDFGNYIVVKYWISDEKLPESELDEKFMDAYYNIEKNDNVLYFEISEYPWEDKGCRHDLIGELSNYIGKYCTLEIEFLKEPQKRDK